MKRKSQRDAAFHHIDHKGGGGGGGGGRGGRGLLLRTAGFVVAVNNSG